MLELKCKTFLNTNSRCQPGQLTGARRSQLSQLLKFSTPHWLAGPHSLKTNKYRSWHWLASFLTNLGFGQDRFYQLRANTTFRFMRLIESQMCAAQVLLKSRQKTFSFNVKLLNIWLRYRKLSECVIIILKKMCHRWKIDESIAGLRYQCALRNEALSKFTQPPDRLWNISRKSNTMQGPPVQSPLYNWTTDKYRRA